MSPSFNSSEAEKLFGLVNEVSASAPDRVVSAFKSSLCTAGFSVATTFFDTPYETFSVNGKDWTDQRDYFAKSYFTWQVCKQASVSSVFPELEEHSLMMWKTFLVNNSSTLGRDIFFEELSKNHAWRTMLENKSEVLEGIENIFKHSSSSLPAIQSVYHSSGRQGLSVLLNLILELDDSLKKRVFNCALLAVKTVALEKSICFGDHTDSAWKFHFFPLDMGTWIGDSGLGHFSKLIRAICADGANTHPLNRGRGLVWFYNMYSATNEEAPLGEKLFRAEQSVPVVATAGCFVEGTTVLTVPSTSVAVAPSNVTPRAIEKIVPGDAVVSFGHKVAEVSDEIVVRTAGPEGITVYGINDVEPFFTEDHMFWTKTGWVAMNPEKATIRNPGERVRRLVFGDIIHRIIENGRSMRYEAVEILKIPHKHLPAGTVVRNINLFDSHPSFHANGFLVGTHSSSITPRQIAKNVQENLTGFDRDALTDQLSVNEGMWRKILGHAATTDILSALKRSQEEEDEVTSPTAEHLREDGNTWNKVRKLKKGEHLTGPVMHSHKKYALPTDHLHRFVLPDLCVIYEDGKNVKKPKVSLVRGKVLLDDAEADEHLVHENRAFWTRTRPDGKTEHGAIRVDESLHAAHGVISVEDDEQENEHSQNRNLEMVEDDPQADTSNPVDTTHVGDEYVGQTQNLPNSSTTLFKLYQRNDDGCTGDLVPHVQVEVGIRHKDRLHTTLFASILGLEEDGYIGIAADLQKEINHVFNNLEFFGNNQFTPFSEINQLKLVRTCHKEVMEGTAVFKDFNGQRDVEKPVIAQAYKFLWIDSNGHLNKKPIHTPTDYGQCPGISPSDLLDAHGHLRGPSQEAASPRSLRLARAFTMETNMTPTLNDLKSMNFDTKAITDGSLTRMKNYAQHLMTATELQILGLTPYNSLAGTELGDLTASKNADVVSFLNTKYTPTYIASGLSSISEYADTWGTDALAKAKLRLPFYLQGRGANCMGADRRLQKTLDLCSRHQMYSSHPMLEKINRGDQRRGPDMAKALYEATIDPMEFGSLQIDTQGGLPDKFKGRIYVLHALAPDNDYSVQLTYKYQMQGPLLSVPEDFNMDLLTNNLMQEFTRTWIRQVLEYNFSNDAGKDDVISEDPHKTRGQLFQGLKDEYDKELARQGKQSSGIDEAVGVLMNSLGPEITVAVQGLQRFKNRSNALQAFLTEAAGGSSHSMPPTKVQLAMDIVGIGASVLGVVFSAMALNHWDDLPDTQKVQVAMNTIASSATLIYSVVKTTTRIRAYYLGRGAAGPNANIETPTYGDNIPTTPRNVTFNNRIKATRQLDETLKSHERTDNLTEVIEELPENGSASETTIPKKSIVSQLRQRFERRRIAKAQAKLQAKNSIPKEKSRISWRKILRGSERVVNVMNIVVSLTTLAISGYELFKAIDSDASAGFIAFQAVQLALTTLGTAATIAAQLSTKVNMRGGGIVGAVLTIVGLIFGLAVNAFKDPSPTAQEIWIRDHGKALVNSLDDPTPNYALSVAPDEFGVSYAAVNGTTVEKWAGMLCQRDEHSYTSTLHGTFHPSVAANFLDSTVSSINNQVSINIVITGPTVQEKLAVIFATDVKLNSATLNNDSLQAFNEKRADKTIVWGALQNANKYNNFYLYRKRNVDISHNLNFSFATSGPFKIAAGESYLVEDSTPDSGSTSSL